MPSKYMILSRRPLNDGSNPDIRARPRRNHAGLTLVRTSFYFTATPMGALSAPKDGRVLRKFLHRPAPERGRQKRSCDFSSAVVRSASPPRHVCSAISSSAPSMAPSARVSRPASSVNGRPLLTTDQTTVVSFLAHATGASLCALPLSIRR